MGFVKPQARVELGEITRHNLGQLKRLNQVIFPVSYNESFYTDILNAGELAKFVYYNDIVVGAVCCRLDQNKVYIMTLGCLSPYRRLGLGTRMLQQVFDICDSHPAVESIYLHVQINNDTALEFYKRFGFIVRETAQNYYKRIEPTDAYVLEYTIPPEARHETSLFTLVLAGLGEDEGTAKEKKMDTSRMNGVHEDSMSSS